MLGVVTQAGLDPCAVGREQTDREADRRGGDARIAGTIEDFEHGPARALGRVAGKIDGFVDRGRRHLRARGNALFLEAGAKLPAGMSGEVDRGQAKGHHWSSGMVKDGSGSGWRTSALKSARIG